MRSTYDRRGGNEGADASHFLYQLADDRNVTLDVEGRGILCFARYNHWHGSPWHYEVDGLDHIVQETSTPDPTHPAAGSIFLPEKPFPNPLTWTWSVTRGADLTWVPIGFERSFRMAYSRTHYGTGYYIYQQFVPGARLSRPIQAWNEEVAPDRDVLDLLSRAGTDLLAPPGSKGARKLHQVSGFGVLPPERLPRDRRPGQRPCDVARLGPLRAARPGTRVRPRPGCASPGMTPSAPRWKRQSRSSSARARSTIATIANTWSRPSRSASNLERSTFTWPATSRCHSSARRGSN